MASNQRLDPYSHAVRNCGFTSTEALTTLLDQRMHELPSETLEEKQIIRSYSLVMFMDLYVHWIQIKRPLRSLKYYRDFLWVYDGVAWNWGHLQTF